MRRIIEDFCLLFNNRSFGCTPLILSTQTQLNFCALQCQHLFGTLFASIFCSGSDYAFIWCYLKQLLQKQHLVNLLVLFRKNLVSNISTKAQKTPYLSSISMFSMQIRSRFNAHFSWGQGIYFQQIIKIYKKITQSLRLFVLFDVFKQNKISFGILSNFLILF